MSATPHRRIRDADRSRPGGESGESTRTRSVTFEIVERFSAALAAPQRLARGRTEFGQHLGIPGAALRACHLLHPEQRAAGATGQRWRDAVLPELAATVFAHPVGGPGR